MHSYFVAASPSIDRHLYTVTLPSSADISDIRKRQEEASLLGVAETLWQDAEGENNAQGGLTPLTDVSSPGYYDVSLSPQAGYFVLSYRGPDVPWQRVISARAEEHDEGKVQLLEGNEALNKTLGEYARPIIDRTTVKVDDYGQLSRVHRGSQLDTETQIELTCRAEHARNHAVQPRYQRSEEISRADPSVSHSAYLFVTNE